MDTSRVQLALNVNDIDEAVAFYGKLFDTTPRYSCRDLRIVIHRHEG